MDWIATVQRCFAEDRVLYSRHARNEMREEELGPISDQEVAEVIAGAEVIESYTDDTPYPSVLAFGRTAGGRPIHLVCAYAQMDDSVIVVTVYHPDPNRWTHDFRRRK